MDQVIEVLKKDREVLRSTCDFLVSEGVMDMLERMLVEDKKQFLSEMVEKHTVSVVEYLRNENKIPKATRRRNIRWYSLYSVWSYGVVESTALVSLLWTTTNQFEGEELWIFGLAVFASVGALAKWLCGYGLLVMTDGETMNVAQEKTDLKSLYESGKQYTELSEVIPFIISEFEAACCAVFVEFTFHSLCSLDIHCISVIDTVLGSR